MDFTYPASTTSTPATATTKTPEPPVAIVVVAGRPLPAPCRRLPSSPRLALASSPPCRFPPAAAVAMVEQGPPGTGAPGGGAAAAAAAAEDLEDRMDLLWEDFNEELAWGGPAACSCRAGGLAHEPWSPGSASDAESEPAARGCAPVLRPSSRARAVRHCRRRAGTWVLLMRIFRRLFVVDKTVSVASARRRHAAATARAS